MISANVARCQSSLAKEQLILLQTDEILKAVETMIDDELNSSYLPQLTLPLVILPTAP